VSGSDLSKTPLEERKERLRDLITPLGSSHAIKYTNHIIGDGARVFERASEVGVEGIVSKRRRSLYRAGRTRDWVKTKCWRSHNFVVGGYVAGDGPGLRELLVGYYDSSGQLRFAGSVGTGRGFTHAFRVQLRAELEVLQEVDSPFNDIDAGSTLVRWVKPVLVVEVAFTELTAGHLLRHPSLRAFQPDARAHDVRLDVGPNPSGLQRRAISTLSTSWHRRR